MLPWVGSQMVLHLLWLICSLLNRWGVPSSDRVRKEYGNSNCSLLRLLSSPLLFIELHLGMAVRKKYRTFSRWSYDEITFLLERVLHCKQVKLLMDSSTKATDGIYSRLSRQLLVGGFNRSAVQIRSKFKNLRLNFYKTIHLAGQDPPLNKKCPFFDDLKQIWVKVGRPQPHGGFHYSLGLSRRRIVGLEYDQPNIHGDSTDEVHAGNQQSGADKNKQSSVTGDNENVSHLIAGQLSEILSILKDHSHRLSTLELRHRRRNAIRRRRHCLGVNQH